MKITPQLLTQKIEQWRNILDIEKRWKISFRVVDNPLEMSEGNEDAMACILVRSGYFLANIEVNALEVDEHELDETILHELLHILIDPLAAASGAGLGKSHEELNSMLVESTIERLVPGYMYLYSKLNNKKPNKKNKSPKGQQPRARVCKKY